MRLNKKLSFQTSALARDPESHGRFKEIPDQVRDDKKEGIKNPVTFLFLLPVLFYKRFISPFLPGRCRFYPSCADYTIQALQTHGVFIGLFLSIKRILKCAPYHPGGVDPVPPSKKQLKGIKLHDFQA